MANQRNKGENKKKGFLGRLGKSIISTLFSVEEESKLKKISLQLLTSLLIITAVGSAIVFGIIHNPAKEISVAYNNLAQETAIYSRLSEDEEKTAQQEKINEAGALYNTIMERYESSDMWFYRQYAKISTDQAQINSTFLYLLIPFAGLIVMLLISGIQKFVARVNVTILAVILIALSPLMLLFYMASTAFADWNRNRKAKKSSKRKSSRRTSPEQIEAV